MPSLEAGRQLDARTAALWPWIKQSARQNEARRLGRLVADGQPRTRRRATPADLAGMGIKVTEVDGG